jgi:hypothetical protein
MLGFCTSSCGAEGSCAKSCTAVAQPVAKRAATIAAAIERYFLALLRVVVVCTGSSSLDPGIVVVLPVGY